jgi:acetylornithine aminotransferase/acetylornithine/N-succinyldiaminopimelate aminotransferase
MNSPLAEIYNQYPFELVRGEGMYVFDTEGRKYIDFYGGHAVSIVGHSNAEVADAISKQARTLMFWSNLARIPIRAEAASKLLAFAATDFTRVFFCNSGGEANENALKLAIKNTGRQKLVSFHGGFHGRTFLAAAATDHPDWHAYMGPRVGPVARIEVNDLDGLSAIDRGTAAVILEPIQSIGGVKVFEADYLKALRKRCNDVGAYLIFDEVQTGVGRTGVPFVSGSCGVVPDMMTLAKGLAGGFAIGAVVMTEAVHAPLKVGDIAATFGGGPMALAAMMKTLEIIQRDDLVRHATEIEKYVRSKAKESPKIREVRGRGCLLGLGIAREAKEVQAELFQMGILTGLCSDKKIVHLLPPLVVQKEHIDQLFACLNEVL